MAFWGEVAALSGLSPEEIIRQGMALSTTGEFYGANPGLIDRSVVIRMGKLQPLHAFTRQSNAAIIRQPTLILADARDRVMSSVLTEELAKKIPQVIFKVFPNAAHLLFLEEADAVNRVLSDFLCGRKVE